MVNNFGGVVRAVNAYVRSDARSRNENESQLGRYMLAVNMYAFGRKVREISDRQRHRSEGGWEVGVRE